MAEFVAFDPNVEVSGRVLKAWIAGTEHKVIPYLEAHEIFHVQPEAWYPKQPALNALRKFGQVSSLFNAGLMIPQHAEFPPNIDDLETAVNLLDQAYHMNHRSGEIGHYIVKAINERSIVMVCENPYPCEFDFGLLHVLAQRFKPEGVEKIEVNHDPDEPCRKTGGDSCTYHIVW
ncbi:MAG: hypothetical protein GYB65_05970 [Chloroflexi bacterium]|nr:hypothetical protein [Chloroflexota bacterium]